MARAEVTVRAIEVCTYLVEAESREEVELIAQELAMGNPDGLEPVRTEMEPTFEAPEIDWEEEEWTY